MQRICGNHDAATGAVGSEHSVSGIGDQLGPIVFRNRSAVDLNPGAEAPLSARCCFAESIGKG